MFSKARKRLISVLFMATLSMPANAGDASIVTPETRLISEGPFIQGSDQEERERAYKLDEAAYGHMITRDNGWYDHEVDREIVTLPDFSVTTTLVTNRDYAHFITDTGHPAPFVDKKTWSGYGLIHLFERTRKFIWPQSTYPTGRGAHPVVLISWEDANAYARWLSSKTGRHWQLPTEAQWEKAARGTDGWYFPWGNDYDPSRLNSHDRGPFDTMPVGQFPTGISPYGVLDAAGQVFEWTRDQKLNGRVIVKGGSWDDKGCGVCRPAARHTRPANLKHILIGFRLVVED